MVKKILFCATVDYHFKAFHLPYMKWLKQHGWQVDIAASGDTKLPYTDQKYIIPIQRHPLHWVNKKAYQQLKNIIDDNDYSIIHCHTPMGGVLTRLAAREARKKGTSVMYTAHGFHFCKGSPWRNWIIYFPIEKYLSKFTDQLITINQEDYQLATKYRFQTTVTHVPGVGVDTERFQPVSENKKRQLKKSFGYQADDFLLFYAAEFNKNKNQQFLLQCLGLIKEEMPNVKLLLAGDGPLLDHCKSLVNQLGIQHMVYFLGFRKDIDQLIPMCDVGVAASFREGLPVNVMECMACGLPIIAVNNRGHRELIQDNVNGWLIDAKDINSFKRKVKMLANHPNLNHQFGKNSRQVITSSYSITNVLNQLSAIYSKTKDDKEGADWIVR